MARLKNKRYALAGALITVWKKLCSLREVCDTFGDDKFNGMPEIWACELFIELWNMDNSKSYMSKESIERFEKTARNLVDWDILDKSVLEDVGTTEQSLQKTE